MTPESDSCIDGLAALHIWQFAKSAMALARLEEMIPEYSREFAERGHNSKPRKKIYKALRAEFGDLTINALHKNIIVRLNEEDMLVMEERWRTQ